MPPPPPTGITARMSPLHAKGILTLTLFLFAESVTFVNAVSGSSSSEQHHRHGNSDPPHHQRTILPHGTANDDMECVAAATGAAPPDGTNVMGTRFLNRLSLFARNRPCAYAPTKAVPRLLDPACCRDCTSCLGQVVSPAAVATMCRGGHSASAAAAATTVEAVVAAVTPYNIPLNAWKIIFQVFLTALNVACWLIPLKSKRISQNKLALSLANAFSGGVFLSLAFGHLIPECLHGFADGNYNEAAPFVLVLAGYLLIFFVEKVAFDAHDILHEMEHAGEQQKHNHVHHASSPPRSGSDKAVTVNGSNPAPATTTATVGSTTASSSTGRSAVILLGALAIHSILEMMALGLANTFGDCALLTLSISLHQPAESIALLVAFLKSGLSESQIITYLSIFSCMGPIGVGLGMLVNEYAAPIVDSIMLAVVAGTFVYVGATEVIPEEWEDSTHKWKKFFALMSGIVSILCITQYTMALGH
jgi:solute carrier family 39 (zinc transporter), member 1/2/3